MLAYYCLTSVLSLKHNTIIFCQHQHQFFCKISLKFIKQPAKFFACNNTQGFLLFTPQGLPGETGDTGGNGAPGGKGEQGATGSPGPRGRPGPAGPVGQPGDKGDAGATGRRGVNGRSGYKGDTVIQAVVVV